MSQVLDHNQTLTVISRLRHGIPGLRETSAEFVCTGVRRAVACLIGSLIREVDLFRLSSPRGAHFSHLNTVCLPP